MSNIIDSTIQSYVKNAELSGAALMVRKGGKVVYHNKWGWTDIADQTPITDASVFRMMSMTKPVTAVGILKLMEKGLLSLDDPITKFLPLFQNMQVSIDKRYEFRPGMNPLSLLPKMLFFRMGNVKTEPATRDITIRDLLSHSSGLAQGIVGLLAMRKDKSIKKSLAQQADVLSQYVLDFQPGTGTGYSPLAGFDMLTRILEVASGMDADAYFRKEIFDPLGMADSFFWPNDTQKQHIVKCYKRKKNRLVDVTGTKDDMYGILACEAGYIAGCGGLFSTLADYDRFAQMLANGGTLDGVTILKPETVELMHTEAPEKHMEPDPGQVWGLGVKIRQDPAKGNLPVTAGTYGWSGAFGTHFFISPKDDLSCVWMTNRTDLGGSGSYISAKIEELVFSEFGG
ncbi:MAG: beta-lactamase family protein [Oscillospiraceae bacterium]|nr:beta-lactamase family protein [Oscillospiraceae bacterium]MBQ6719084.1 beta-lactamase family protein [Oscillospiraceae bacterium]